MRGVFAVLLVACLAPFTSAAEVDPAAEKVIEKAIQAHGGALALGKYKAGETTVKGTMSMFGMDIAYTGEVSFALPAQAKLTLNLDVAQQKVKVVQIANGDKFSTLLNGEAKKMKDEEKAELRQAAMMQEISTLLPLLSKLKYTVKADKDGKAGEADVAVVVVTAPGFIETRLGFDKKTGLLVQTVRKALTETGEQAVEDSIMSDFKKVDGILLPMTVTVTRDKKKFMTMTVTAAKVLEKLDPKVFE